jgi:hypothetical protein
MVDFSWNFLAVLAVLNIGKEVNMRCRDSHIFWGRKKEIKKHIYYLNFYD